ncbi:hypothetical protein NDU88_003998 [Pleurodeles waltl]|uniref:Uncharacterized protein n=1 Tax=Pleurodeles waltl TaxID=8319 RepID=A0AAV7WU31_PLEWA|nr:hypothetical protein NDU88_003998 [Pleurodeles waltl]
MVRPWNRLTSRGTVRSSLHEILRSPEEIRRGVKDPHSTRRSCRRAGTNKKVQTNGDGERTEETLEGKRGINGDEQDEVERQKEGARWKRKESVKWRKKGAERQTRSREATTSTYTAFNPLPTGTQPRATPTSPDDRRRAQRRPHSPIALCT